MGYLECHPGLKLMMCDSRIKCSSRATVLLGYSVRAISEGEGKIESWLAMITLLLTSRQRTSPGETSSVSCPRSHSVHFWDSESSAVSTNAAFPLASAMLYATH